jgi:hypothetical protein
LSDVLKVVDEAFPQVSTNAKQFVHDDEIVEIVYTQMQTARQLWRQAGRAVAVPTGRINSVAELNWVTLIHIL